MELLGREEAFLLIMTSFRHVTCAAIIASYLISKCCACGTFHYGFTVASSRASNHMDFFRINRDYMQHLEIVLAL